MKGQFTIPGKFVAAYRSFWMAVWWNRRGNLELLPMFTNYTRRGLIQQLEHGFGEPWRELKKQGCDVVHFVPESAAGRV